ncbi:MAG: ribulose-bisphosphate carboxylase large subunit [Candidatus Diapherotrites archaeon]|uniref:Ribulose-bisphosphate carboxylase large subunit n=1 Tax=Candidatus Iainarchaeum sp. TaxID=3101447 RepID=A0A7K4BYN1_9ARCH|nr:ribulose-bisphosphate carboxylase large subunit [Candidatus Diapherotrites archaeon]
MVVERLETYLNLKYKPENTDLICVYSIEPAKGVTLETVARKVASEAGLGTWTELKNIDETTFKKFSPKIFEISKKNNIVKIAFPENLFEARNIPQVLSSIAGNIFSMREIKTIKLLDIEFPDSFVKHYYGPHYGVPGIRRLMRIPHRPLLSCVIKPKVGLTIKEYAKLAEEAWRGGADLVGDDENLTSLEGNDFDERIRAVLDVKRRVERETGEVKEYLPNITGSYNQMVSRAKMVISHGGRFVLVDAFTIGWSGLQALRELDLNIVIHAHKAGHGVFTKANNHGISMLVVSKICRLIGVDELQVGGIGNKETTEIMLLGEKIEDTLISEKIFKHKLQEDWMGLAPVMAVCSGAIHPQSVSPLIHSMGRDIVIQAGGGIHGHPSGTFAGAKAMRDAIEAEMNGIDVKEAAKNSKELSEAIKKWSK